MTDESNLTTSGGSLHAPPEFRFREAFARHWRDSLRHYGLWQTLRQEAEALYRFLRELLPDRRKVKFADLDYDWDHMVDTTRANVAFRTQLAAALTGHQYFPSEPWLFEQIMRALPIDFSQFTFLDLGSGKGRTLLMAAPCGFRRVLGVEYIPELHRIAQENIRKFMSGHRIAAEIQSVCLDARDFDFPLGPLVLYLFNPFPEPVFVTVLNKLRLSIESRPRPVFIAYRFPEFESVLKECDWLEKIAGTEQWTVYKNRRDRT
jgi:SAM-dependent methyltransferase